MTVFPACSTTTATVLTRYGRSCTGSRILISTAATGVTTKHITKQQQQQLVASARRYSSTLSTPLPLQHELRTSNDNKNNRFHTNLRSSSSKKHTTGSSSSRSVYVSAYNNNNNTNNNRYSKYNTKSLLTSTIAVHGTTLIYQQVRCFAANSGKRDFYELLGVSKKADKSTIKKAYFKLAKQYHPDTNQGDDSAMEKFKEVTAAYEVLSDDKQRQMYDQFGHAGVDPNYQQSSGNPFEQAFSFGDGSFHFSTSTSSSGGGSGNGEIDAEDLLEMFFGGGGGKKSRKNRGPRRGSDLQMQVKLTFMEAVFGTKKEVPLRYQVINRETGATQTKDRTVTIDTPPGIDTGMNLRFQGQGTEGDPGAPAGNLLVQVVVADDAYFARDGFDVHTEAPISLTQAVLGGTVEVRTLTGEVEMKIPKGCQPDAKLMMRNKGIQQVQGSRKGNHIVHLKIEIPQEITPRQEQLLREFDAETGKHNLGISGRIAQVAESAFESLFGSKKKGTKKDDSDDDDDEVTKKHAAQ